MDLPELDPEAIVDIDGVPSVIFSLADFRAIEDIIRSCRERADRFSQLAAETAELAAETAELAAEASGRADRAEAALSAVGRAIYQQSIN